jgi:gluconolactonase
MFTDLAFPTTAGWRSHPRYPDPAITALDPRFEQYWLKQSAVERLYTGCRWSEGPVWFGDGRYLLWSDIPNNRVLKWEEATGTVEASVVADNVLGPNGLCFAPDESLLYVVESRGVPHRKILAYDVTANGRELRNKRVLIDAGPGGTPDGMRCDIDGNLWCGWGMGTEELDGVIVFAPDGTPIGRIALPERCANVCFGGLKRNRLFMAASQSLYALYVNTQGVQGG